MSSSIQEKYFTIYQDICVPVPRHAWDFFAKDDFTTGGYRLPDFGDLKKWNNRIYKNLIYYQSNYFLFFLVMVLVNFYNVLLWPAIFVGSIMMPKLIADNVHIENEQYESLLRNLGPIVIGSLMFWGFPQFVASVGILCVIILTVLVHASLRKRTWDNKLSNVVGKIKQKRTLMQDILNFFPEPIMSE
uniref:PRA1 family protein n=1 Tax=Rhabditophanes sp. KR3021 TaxID=114890 RepID=A0AC35U4M1_9BILA